MHSSRNWILAAAVAAVATMSGSSLHAQAAATICKDGTTSISSGRGACSGHGGVNKKAITHQKKVVKNEVKAATAVAKRTPGAQVTTLCVDGTTSNSTGRGTCSGHGGAKGAEATSRVTGEPVRAPGTAAAPRASARAGVRANSNSTVAVGSGSGEDNNPAGAIARCKDGMYSHARNHRGACSRHGGVGSWM
ncbi:MAG: DUF3761 domain-containing protein [Gemmatimonadota bacterium]|nr:DUF3761 domain-containing protein [Gemmatimonadota bacterium]